MVVHADAAIAPPDLHESLPLGGLST